jgi:hypothetical protein
LAQPDRLCRAECVLADKVLPEAGVKPATAEANAATAK